MKSIVFYHGNCDDGFGAAYAAWAKLGYEDAKYIPVGYNEHRTQTQELRELVQDNTVYILDFSFPKDVFQFIMEHAYYTVWLDHHKTAFEMWKPELEFTDESKLCEEVGTEKINVAHIELDNTRSGAMISWMYFNSNSPIPKLIKHIDDNDRWQFKLSGTKEVIAGLRSKAPYSFELFDMIMRNEQFALSGLKEDGRAITAYKNVMIDQNFLKDTLPIILPGGIKGYACNSHYSLASELGHKLAEKSGTFGLVWYLTGSNKVYASLRSVGDYDVSAIAKSLGGGGHKNAAGFETTLENVNLWINLQN